MQLTSPDYREMRKEIYRAGHGKEELKARASLPNEAQVSAVLQALEDDTVSHFSTVKGLIDSNIGGANTTTVLAQKIYAGYLKWKIDKLLGL